MTTTGMSPVLSDEELFSRTVETGDNKPFEALYLKYSEELSRFIQRHYLRQRDLTEDAVQQTFIQALENKASFNPAFNFRKWLFSLGANIAINMAQQIAIRKDIQLSRMRTETTERDRTSEYDPEDHREAQQLEVELKQSRIDSIWRASERLSNDEQRVVGLVFRDGLSYKEAAERTGTPVSSLGVQIHRAIGKMRKMKKLEAEAA